MTTTEVSTNHTREFPTKLPDHTQLYEIPKCLLQITPPAPPAPPALPALHL
jgi:hypothetical protein